MTAVRDLGTNVCPVEFDADRVGAWVREIAEGEDLGALREKWSPSWTVQWEQGKVFFFPLSNGHPAPPPDTTHADVKVGDHLRMMARLVNDALIRRFPEYEPLRRKPFIFLGRRRNLLEDAGRVLGVDNPLLGGFCIWPKYSLDGRVLETRAGSPFVGIVVDLSTRWEVGCDLESLRDAGIDMRGLFAVRRHTDPGERRLVGRIAVVQDGQVELSESTGGETSVEAASVMLEGRLDAFARCLGHLLGKNYTRYSQYVDKQTGGMLDGPALTKEIARVGELIGRHPLDLARGLKCRVRSPMTVGNAPGYDSVVRARKLDYCFDAARSKRHEYAWPGLEKYGPFSRDTFARPTPRIMVVFPRAAQGAVENFIRCLQDGIPRSKGFQSGFATTFGLINPRFEPLPVPEPGNAPAQEYRKVIMDALARGEPPDAAIVIIADQDADLPEVANPYWHSKAVLLMAGVSTQHLRLSRIMNRPESLQYILQNFCIALYAKLKGIPWTVDHDLTIADELVIGVGAVELSGSRLQDRQRYVGITTVFRGDGNYLLGQLAAEAPYAEYPQVLRDSTRSIIEEIKKRNGWQPGDTVRIIFHASRPPRHADFALLMRDAVNAVGQEQHVEFAFVTVSHEHPFQVFDQAQQGQATRNGGRKGVHVPERGLIVQTGRYSRLVTTAGVSLVKRPGVPMPRPLQVHLHQHSTFTDLHYLSEQVLKFTGLSWRSTLPASDPVTIYYSELIARQLGRLHAISGWSPALLDARLRTSKWFL